MLCVVLCYDLLFILFCFVLFCFDLFCFDLFYSVLIYFVLLCYVLFCLMFTYALVSLMFICSQQTIFVITRTHPHTPQTHTPFLPPTHTHTHTPHPPHPPHTPHTTHTGRKATSLSAASRIADFLGPEMVKDKGEEHSCKLILSYIILFFLI